MGNIRGVILPIKFQMIFLFRICMQILNSMKSFKRIVVLFSGMSSTLTKRTPKIVDYIEIKVSDIRK